MIEHPRPESNDSLAFLKHGLLRLKPLNKLLTCLVDHRTVFINNLEPSQLAVVLLIVDENLSDLLILVQLGRLYLFFKSLELCLQFVGKSKVEKVLEFAAAN